MEITKIKCSKLVMNEGQIDGLPINPRQWKKDDIERLARSLQETPELFEMRPCIVYPLGAKYIVLGGNMRLTAARSLKLTEVPCVIVPEGTATDKLKEIVIKDNGSFGEWDYDELANAWSDLPLEDWGVPAWDSQPTPEVKEAEEDDFDENTEEIETRVQKGDIWKLGDHRLMCGDSTSETDIAELMDGQLADLWLTDPPYNVDYQEKERYKKELGYGSTIHEEAIKNDKMNNDEFYKFLVGAYSAAKGALKPGAVFYIWHSDSEGYNFRAALNEIGDMKLAETLIWAKDQLCFGRQDYHWKHEPCLYGWKEGAGHKWYSDRKQTTLLNFERPRISAEHPTMKPVALFAYQIQNSTAIGDIVLDSFGGSGTTIIAAEQLGRKAYIMELSEHYCDVIIARWEKLTGKTAEKI